MKKEPKEYYIKRTNDLCKIISENFKNYADSGEGLFEIKKSAYDMQDCLEEFLQCHGFDDKVVMFVMHATQIAFLASLCKDKSVYKTRNSYRGMGDFIAFQMNCFISEFYD